MIEDIEGGIKTLQAAGLSSSAALKIIKPVEQSAFKCCAAAVLKFLDLVQHSSNTMFGIGLSVSMSLVIISQANQPYLPLLSICHS